jgi:cytosine/adenosine deaminase-related metal-dependent hydrolase
VLVRNGHVIDVDPEPIARPNTDVLIESGRIAAVGPDLPADGAEIIDATDRVVLPGFVDTHRHVWQAALRGIATDVTLGEYFALVAGQLGPLHTARHVRTATLAGALDCLDSGITTVQDYAHIQYTPDHTAAGVAALRAAGIRAVFGHAAPPLAADISPETWHARVRAAHAEHFPGDKDDLVTMALAAAGPSYSSEPAVLADWRLADELGIPVVTHVAAGPVADRPIELLRALGLLRPTTVYAHGNTLADDELALIADSGGTVAIAPAVEARMGHGAPMVNRLRAAGVRTGLGVDVVTSTAGDMFSLMRAALLSGHLSPGDAPTPADILRMATLDGAAALGLADRVGSLRAGKRADLVLLDATAPNLVGGFAHDPVGTVVTAAHPGNVDTVLVDGVIVKRAGRLTHAELADITAEIARDAEFFARAR